MKATQIVIKKTGAIEGRYSSKRVALAYARVLLKRGTYRFEPCSPADVPAGF
jgi:hypothetical protein